MAQLGSTNSRQEKCKRTKSIHYKRVPTLPQTQHQPAPMGKQSFSDPIVLGSSIALLQERFKQLQRVRETREDRLQRGEQPKWPRFPAAHPGHRHGPGSGRMEWPEVALDISIYMGSWPHASADQSSELRTEADVVDTSLHL